MKDNTLTGIVTEETEDSPVGISFCGAGELSSQETMEHIMSLAKKTGVTTEWEEELTKSEKKQSSSPSKIPAEEYPSSTEEATSSEEENSVASSSDIDSTIAEPTLTSGTEEKLVNETDFDEKATERDAQVSCAKDGTMEEATDIMTEVLATPSGGAVDGEGAEIGLPTEQDDKVTVPILEEIETITTKEDADTLEEVDSIEEEGKKSEATEEQAVLEVDERNTEYFEPCSESGDKYDQPTDVDRVISAPIKESDDDFSSEKEAFVVVNDDFSGVEENFGSGEALAVELDRKTETELNSMVDISAPASFEDSADPEDAHVASPVEETETDNTKEQELKGLEGDIPIEEGKVQSSSRNVAVVGCSTEEEESNPFSAADASGIQEKHVHSTPVAKVVAITKEDGDPVADGYAVLDVGKADVENGNGVEWRSVVEDVANIFIKGFTRTFSTATNNEEDKSDPTVEKHVFTPVEKATEVENVTTEDDTYVSVYRKYTRKLPTIIEEVDGWFESAYSEVSKKVPLLIEEVEVMLEARPAAMIGISLAAAVAFGAALTLARRR